MSFAWLGRRFCLGSWSRYGDVLLNNLQSVIDVAEIPSKEEVTAGHAKGDPHEDHDGDCSPTLKLRRAADLPHDIPGLAGRVLQLSNRPFEGILDGPL